EIIRTRKNIIHPAPARTNQGGGHHRARGGLPPKEERLLHVFAIARPGADPGGLLRGVVEQQAHLFGTETRGTTGGGARSEGRGGAVCAAVSGGLVGGTAHAHGDAGADVMAERDSPHRMRSSDCKLLARSNRGGNTRYAGVRGGRAMGVIGFVGMREF